MRSVIFNGQAVQPGKVICVGKNYAAHIAEMDSVPAEEMVVFMKPNSSMGDTLMAEIGEPIHYEGEICLLIERGEAVGVAFGLDLTKRATQSKLKAAGLPWERSKAFNGSALFSEFVTAPEDLNKLGVELLVNEVLRQKGDVSLMLYPPSVILEELKHFLTLDDFDIVMTGTPAGVGPVRAGERFRGRVLNGETELIDQEWLAS